MGSITIINHYVVDPDQTVSEFLAQFEIDDKFTALDFLNLKLLKALVKDSAGKPINLTNLDRIRAKYSADELKDATNQIASELSSAGDKAKQSVTGGVVDILKPSPIMWPWVGLFS